MKTKPPILPKRPADPTGTDALERSAMRDFRARMRKVRRVYLDALETIPAERVTVNRSYTYQLDQYLLRSILDQTDRAVDLLLLDGGVTELWFFEQYVSTAYQRGAAQEWANLAQQSPAYRGATGTLADLLRSEPYRRRLALIAAREFEEMKGLAGNVKANMTRVLTDGIGRGLNPREVARTLTEQTGIEERRANRIARTEINTALRRARLDESEDAQERYGLRTMELYLSALSPTTRASHRAKHGRLFSVEELRDWWASGAESINCKCSAASVLVDDSGQPLFPAIIERAKAAEKRMRKA